MGIQHWLVVAQWDATAEDFVPIAVLPQEERALAEMIARTRLLYPGKADSRQCPVVERTGAQLARLMMSIHLDIPDVQRRNCVKVVLDDGKGYPAAVVNLGFDDSPEARTGMEGKA